MLGGPPNNYESGVDSGSTEDFKTLMDVITSGEDESKVAPAAAGAGGEECADTADNEKSIMPLNYLHIRRALYVQQISQDTTDTIYQAGLSYTPENEELQIILQHLQRDHYLQLKKSEEAGMIWIHPLAHDPWVPGEEHISTPCAYNNALAILLAGSAMLLTDHL